MSAGTIVRYTDINLGLVGGYQDVSWIKRHQILSAVQSLFMCNGIVIHFPQLSGLEISQRFRRQHG